MTAAQILPLLDDWLEAEFSPTPMDDLAAGIAALAAAEQAFVLDWVRRSAAANVQVGRVFAAQAPRLVTPMNHRSVRAWAEHALDELDRVGLKAALDGLREPQRFVGAGRERAAGAVFDDIAGVLRHVVQGLSGRSLKLARAGVDRGAHTDGETVFLPAVIDEFDAAADNFALAKAMVALLWAQTRFGSFRADIAAACARHADPARSLACFERLETLRLEAAIDRRLPGIGREMRRLRQLARADALPDAWVAWRERLASPQASVDDTLICLEQARGAALPPAAPFQCELHPALVAATMASRIEREKRLLRFRLAEMRDAAPPAVAQAPGIPRARFDPVDEPNGELAPKLLVLDGMPVPVPADVAQLLTSIRLDLGGIPPELLVPAGPGEYDPQAGRPDDDGGDDACSGGPHEEGATACHEWDHRRQHFRKHWCVVRETDVPQVHDDHRRQVLARHPGLARRLRRTFEAMRDRDRVDKRQLDGDELDLDALVEAAGDAHAGRDAGDRLFTRRIRADRDIAALFLVDMSGSTRGWINDVERDALLLLCEALQMLGDRYAIYGFSGMSRKKCELYRVKRFDEPYGADVQARISGIRPQEYTRMGFAVRRATALLGQVQARTRLLITLSDGKPDDYPDRYRGRYGIEDTRRALQEAAREGIRPFCITVDREARDYLPHLYGAARFTVVDDVARLPRQVADLYSRLTR